jgi:hypothetical protein
MADYIADSVHDLLESGSETSSDPDSEMGSHHPPFECFMSDLGSEREPTPKGFVEDALDNEVAPPG